MESNGFSEIMVFGSIIFRGLNRPQWKNVLFLDPCCYCGRFMDPSNLPDAPNRATIEHIIPKSLITDQSYWRKRRHWHVHEVVGACFHCNRERGSESLLQYLLKRHQESGC